MVLQCFQLIVIVGPRPIFGVSYVFVWFSIGFLMVLVCSRNRWPLPDPQLSYDFLLFSIGFPMVLLCFRLILIVGPRPIFGHLMISYGLVWFCYGFGMFPVDFNHRPSPDLRLSYHFPWICMVSLGFVMFLVDCNRRPSPDLRLSYDFVWFCSIFL